tara:strand:+ start:603 stop:1520 length:918 start_codon:yes stop_codon:yes gene_type:complete
MKIYHRATIGEADIDNLGHMNVRVYAKHAALAVNSLLGIVISDQLEPTKNSLGLLDYDSYTTFRREQLLGANLEVWAGVLEVTSSDVEVYLEVRNSANKEVAAAFRKKLKPVGRQDQTGMGFSNDDIQRAEKFSVVWPAHLRPRSVLLGKVRDDITPKNLEDAGVGIRFDGYLVGASDVDEDGRMDMGLGPWLAFAKRPIKPTSTTSAPWFGEGNVAVATLESRQTLLDIPRLGDEVVTYTAITEVKEKILRFCHWSYERKTSQLFSILEEVGIGLNLDTRKSCAFPEGMKTELENACRPFLRPA